MKKIVDNIAILCLIIIVLLLIVNRCIREELPLVEERIDTVYIYRTDTITRTITQIEYQDMVIYREIPQVIDTFEILRDYYAVRYYERYIEEEKLKLTIKDSISQNKLIWNEVDYTYYVDTVFRDITIERKITQFRRGFYGNLSISHKSLSPGISYMNRKGYQIGIGIHISEELIAPHLHVSVPF